jgi:hypothetical protein
MSNMLVRCLMSSHEQYQTHYHYYAQYEYKTHMQQQLFESLFTCGLVGVQEVPKELGERLCGSVRIQHDLA